MMAILSISFAIGNVSSSTKHVRTKFEMFVTNPRRYCEFQRCGHGQYICKSSEGFNEEGLNRKKYTQKILKNWKLRQTYDSLKTVSSVLEGDRIKKDKTENISRSNENSQGI